MKTEYCPDYVGVACVDGTCPVANCEEYAERCMPVISSCRNCFYYPDRFNCPYVNRIGQLTVSVLLNRFARKEHRA